MFTRQGRLVLLNNHADRSGRASKLSMVSSGNITKRTAYKCTSVQSVLSPRTKVDHNHVSHTAINNEFFNIVTIRNHTYNQHHTQQQSYQNTPSRLTRLRLLNRQIEPGSLPDIQKVHYRCDQPKGCRNPEDWIFRQSMSHKEGHEHHQKQNVQYHCNNF